jgi:hypothetical protein
MMYGTIAFQKGQNKQTIIELLSVFVHGHGGKHAATKAEEPLKAAA